MELPVYVTLSRQTALQRQMDVVANNLANINTPAYKDQSLSFAQYLMPGGDPNVKGDNKIAFVQDVATVPDLTEGPLSHTGNPLDFAIHGKGYFTVNTKDGVRYTRYGSFSLDNKGQLVTNDGHPLLDTNGQPIVIPNGTNGVEVAHDGTVSTRNPNNPGKDTVVGRLGLVQFNNEYALKREAGGLMNPGKMQPQPAQGAEVIQGMIEKSNVKGVVEMTKLIETSRRYNQTAKMITSEHDRQKLAIKLLGSPAGQA
jgi:flagellar basal-body rod protein FlgF